MIEVANGCQERGRIEGRVSETSLSPSFLGKGGV
jgi:hypothetical protein